VAVCIYLECRYLRYSLVFVGIRFPLCLSMLAALVNSKGTIMSGSFSDALLSRLFLLSNLVSWSCSQANRRIPSHSVGHLEAAVLVRFGLTLRFSSSLTPRSSSLYIIPLPVAC
jgi:hypothetical protein